MNPRRRLSGLTALWLYLRTWWRIPALYSKRSPLFRSKMYRLTWRGEPLAVKVVARRDPAAWECLTREHVFLRVFAHDNIVPYRSHLLLPRRYVLVTEWIEGVSLDEAINTVAGRAAIAHRASAFAHDCGEIVGTLHRAGIRHRDIREKNIILRDGRPVLLDFGWAAWTTEAEIPTPATLPAVDDAAAMAAVVRRVCAAGPLGRLA